MPTPDHSNGAPCWIDLMTSDTEKAKAFYGELLAGPSRRATRKNTAATSRPGRTASPWPE